MPFYVKKPQHGEIKQPFQGLIPEPMHLTLTQEFSFLRNMG